MTSEKLIENLLKLRAKQRSPKWTGDFVLDAKDPITFRRGKESFEFPSGVAILYFESVSMEEDLINKTKKGTATIRLFFDPDKLTYELNQNG